MQKIIIKKIFNGYFERLKYMAELIVEIENEHQSIAIKRLKKEARKFSKDLLNGGRDILDIS